jgi:phosphatidylserine/phosphatidylglycerophosphate/cardiolipin synthase-like enzyme
MTLIGALTDRALFVGGSQAETIEEAPVAVRDAAGALLQPGRNCWRVAEARRLSLIIDGAAYFQALRRAFLRARRSIVIVGWDFDHRVVLDPLAEDDYPKDIGALLLRLVEERPELRVRILIWDYSVIFGSSRETPVIFGTPWYQGQDRISFRSDSAHPLESCHHQKIVCIDDSVAFVGGIDLTSNRWDIPGHPANHVMRVDTEGAPCDPVHDVHAAVDGPVAKWLSVVARDRWKDATGEELEPPGELRDVWPEPLRPTLEDLPVAIARTIPPYGERAEVREIEALITDALQAARKWIYIEAQFLAGQVASDGLADALSREDGPEIVVLLRHECESWLEQLIMGTNRDRLLRRLKKADRFDRLRVYMPMTAHRLKEVSLHSKLMMIDGRFLRIGSANLNNRSMGVDTECDIAVDVKDPAQVEALTAFRDRLLAEHLGTTPDEVAAEIAKTGSLIAAVEALNVLDGWLRPFDIDPEAGSDEPILGTALLDPREPVNLNYLWRSLTG